MEDHFEKEVAQGKILVSLHVLSAEELPPIAEALHRAGASEVFYSGRPAA
jgi:hypothetical protein